MCVQLYKLKAEYNKLEGEYNLLYYAYQQLTYQPEPEKVKKKNPIGFQYENKR